MKKIFVTIIIVSGFLAVTAQESKRGARLFEKARQAFFRQDYPAAIGAAHKLLTSDSTNTNAHLLLADIYNTLDSAKQEINHLEFVFNNTPQAKNLVGFRLGEAYFSIAEYKKSLTVFEKALAYGGISPTQKEKIDDRITRCRFAMDAILNPVAGEAQKLGEGVNTPADEYWPVLSIDGSALTFTRLEISENSFRQEDFFTSRFTDGEWGQAQPLSEINTPENEGAQTISADGNLMFFSACNRGDGVGSCDIYFTRKINGRWQKPRNAGSPVSTEAWESQPSLTANAGFLYFASNREGGKGKMDIWRCKLKGFRNDGLPDWGTPENLGDSINTPGNESSPFIHFNARSLYFASDYWPGLGKKDIFYCEYQSGSGWAEAVNIGYPINTENDEQGFFIDAKGETAYYASNRQGDMDIYSFLLYPEIQPPPVTYLKGSVEDAVTGEPLQATVELVDTSRNYFDKITTGENGEFLLCLPLSRDYACFISHPGYLFYSESFGLKKIYDAGEPYNMEIRLQPIAIGVAMVLKNVYFETGSFKLLPASMPELEKTKKLLEENPGIQVRIEGHTDNVGGKEYNDALSENRARSVYNYLVNSGIKTERLSYKGFGFSQPAASNKSEEGRGKNRRTELRLIAINKK